MFNLADQGLSARNTDLMNIFIYSGIIATFISSLNLKI